MKNTQGENSSIFEKLRLMKECPLCSHNYKDNKAVVLEENKDSHLVHITCPKCNNAILAMVVISPLGMNTIAIITDLSAKEVANFKRRPPVSEDELLSFHQFIQQQNKLEKIIINKI